MSCRVVILLVLLAAAVFIGIGLGILVTPPAHAGEWFGFDPPSKTDVAYGLLNYSLIAIDWRQSSVGRKEGFSEIDPCLGTKYPSQGRLNTAAGVGAASYTLVALILPAKEDRGYKRYINRETFALTVAVLEGANDARNQWGVHRRVQQNGHTTSIAMGLHF